MIACIFFSDHISSYPRLNQLLQNEFQHYLVVYEDEQTIFVYNVNENAVRHTMFILEIAGIRAGYGFGKSKKETKDSAMNYLRKYERKQCT